MTDFARAAISYLGLPEDTVLIPSDPGHVAFQIPLSMALVAGIADRMNVLAEAEQEAPLAVREMPSREALRDEYNALSHMARGRYGSFAMYLQARWSELGALGPGPDPFAVDVPGLLARDAQLHAQYDALPPDEKAQFRDYVDWLNGTTVPEIPMPRSSRNKEAPR